jgi:recombination protein RecT
METGLQRFNAVITSPACQSYIKNVLQDKAGSFTNNIVSLVSSNVNLQSCEPFSVMFVGITATGLGLPLNNNLGCAYAIPYKNSHDGVTYAQFQMGYKGFTQLAMRSGQFKKLNVTEVREGELKKFDVLTGDVTIKAVDDRDSKPVIGYAAYMKLVNGFEKTIYWDKGKVEKHALRYSQTYRSANAYTKKSSKWTTDFDDMAKKTVLVAMLRKWAPLSVEMQTAIENDQATFDKDGNKVYIDNENTDISAELAMAAQRAAGVQDEQVEEIKEDKSNAKLFKDAK